MQRFSVARLLNLSRTLTFKVASASLVSAVLVTLGMTWWVTHVIQDQATEALRRSITTRVEASAHLLSSRVDIMQTVLAAAAPAGTAFRRADEVDLRTHLDAQDGLYGLFDWAFVGSPQGRLAVSSGPHQLPSGASTARLDAALWREGALSQAALARGKQLTVLMDGQDSAIVLTVPILAADGRLLGLVGGVVAFNSPQFTAVKRLVEQDLTPSDGHSAVLTAAGMVLMHHDPRLAFAPVENDTHLREAFQQWRAAGGVVQPEGQTYRSTGAGVLALSGIPAGPWLLVQWADDRVALQPMRDTVRWLWGVGLALTTLVGGAAAWGVWLSTASVRRLHSQAERLLHEPSADPATREWLSEDSDIGRLAQAFRQVVEQREAQGAETHRLLDQLSAVLDLAPVGIALTRNGRIDLVSEHLARLMGVPAAELYGKSTDIVETEHEDREAFGEAVRLSLEETGFYDGHARIRRPDGNVFHARLRARAVVRGSLEAGTVWIVEDVTAELEAQRNLSWQAGHDALTGLSNRGVFERELKRAFETPVTETQPPFCALFIDLDRFKQVNDTAGHAAGDRVLCDVAMMMVAQVRQNDVVARIGGDEFAVLLPHCPLNRAVAIAEAIRREVENYRLMWDETALGVGASIGVIVNNGNFDSTDTLMRAADAACYVAKHGGRNRVVVGERAASAG